MRSIPLQPITAFLGVLFVLGSSDLYAQDVREIVEVALEDAQSAARAEEEGRIEAKRRQTSHHATEHVEILVANARQTAETIATRMPRRALPGYPLNDEQSQPGRAPRSTPPHLRLEHARATA